VTKNFKKLPLLQQFKQAPTALSSSNILSEHTRPKTIKDIFTNAGYILGNTDNNNIIKVNIEDP
jgi:hypothetical protein